MKRYLIATEEVTREKIELPINCEVADLKDAFIIWSDNYYQNMPQKIDNIRKIYNAMDKMVIFLPTNVKLGYIKEIQEDENE